MQYSETPPLGVGIPQSAVVQYHFSLCTQVFKKHPMNICLGVLKLSAVLVLLSVLAFYCYIHFYTLIPSQQY